MTKTTPKLPPLQESSSSDDETSSPSTDEKQATPTITLDSTFTKDKNDVTESDVENIPPVTVASGTAIAGCKTPPHNDHYHLMAGSALATTLAAKSTTGGPQSYAMTPAENDPLHIYESYDIANLSSDDSTDDEDCPKKVK